MKKFFISECTGHCSTFTTKDDGKYDRTLFKPLCNINKAIIFNVRAKNDASVGFFTDKKSDKELYDIVIGGWGNTQSVILRERKINGNYLVTKATANILNATEDRTFWADANNGVVRLGEGPIIGKKIVMSWTDEKPLNTIYVGFSTGWGATGDWNACSSIGNYI